MEIEGGLKASHDLLRVRRKPRQRGIAGDERQIGDFDAAKRKRKDNGVFEVTWDNAGVAVTANPYDPTGNSPGFYVNVQTGGDAGDRGELGLVELAEQIGRAHV